MSRETVPLQRVRPGGMDLLNLHENKESLSEQSLQVRQTQTSKQLSGNPALGEQTEPILRLYALGAEYVEYATKLVTPDQWRWAKARELLFYIATSSVGCTKEQIGLALWPDASPKQLRYNLHKSLHLLRHTLDPEWIFYQHRYYTLNRKLPYWFDVEIFERLLKQAMYDNIPGNAITTLEKAIDIYRGNFLENGITWEWSATYRDDLRRKYHEALQLLGQLHFLQGQYRPAANAYHKLITHDPYHETGHRELMRCYARQGERSQALQHYHKLVGWLREELGIEPAQETTTLIEHLIRGESA